MNQKRRSSRSNSRRKNFYAPIMVTSKAVKPITRQTNCDASQQSKSPQHNSNFRSKLARFTKHSQVQVGNKQHQCSDKRQELRNDNQQQLTKVQQIERMNMTQQNITNFPPSSSTNLRNPSLDKTFSHSCRKTKLLSVSASEIVSIPNAPNCGLDDVYSFQSNKQNYKQFESFYNMREPTSSAVVNLEFNEENLAQKSMRKNNTNSQQRYHLLFASGNSTPSVSRPSKSLFAHAKNAKVSGNIANKNCQEALGQNHKLVSSSLTKNEPSSTAFNSSTFHSPSELPNPSSQPSSWMKDPVRNLVLSNKQKAFDLTFTNFKQKIYQKKMSKLSSQKTKYTDEWNQYLNKYYLNIKKVRPLIKYDQDNSNNAKNGAELVRSNHNSPDNKNCSQNNYYRDSKSSAQIMLFNEMQSNKHDDSSNKKMVKINSILEGYSDQLQSQKIERIRSSTLMAPSKQATAMQKGNKNRQYSPQRQRLHKSGNGDLDKIETDVITKRVSTNRKDYFVFSMGDSSSQNKMENPNILKFNIYKDFLWKVNYSNGIYVRFPDDVEKPYKFFVGRGNNSAIIKGIMRRRFWWQLVDKISADVNFVWTQLRVNDFVRSQKKRKHQQLLHILQKTNQEPVHGTSQKQLTSQSVKEISEIHKKVFRGNDFSLWLSHYKHHSKNQEKYFQQPGYNILQKRLKSLIKRKKLSYIDSSATSQQKSHNHFQCNYYIGNKKALFYAMRKYYKLYGMDPFDFIPLTYHISGGLEDPEFNEFLERYNLLNDQRMKNKNSDLKNIWIVKPGQVTNRGRGITVCATLDEIKIRLKSKQKNSDGSLRTYILQKYIQKPFLYQKRKFDIRHYMLMTCINGSIKGYWYQQGYIRTTSTEYNIKNCKDLYTHLTNDAIQKNSSDYGKYEKGNKISYEQFQKYLTKTYRSDFDFFSEVLPKMKRLATDAMRATYSIIEPNRRQNNFELFGLDFMLDESMNVYLIECNTNPCLQLSCPLLSKIISGLIQNVFKICIDPVFPPPFEWPNSKKFQMGDHAMNEMKFQLVFDQNQDGKQIEQLFGTEKGFGNKIGKVEEQEQQYEDDGAEDEEWNEDQNP